MKYQGTLVEKFQASIVQDVFMLVFRCGDLVIARLKSFKKNNFY